MSAIRILRALVLSVWLTGCATVPPPRAQARPESPASIATTPGTWRHEASGLEFPERLDGSFHRVWITRFDAAATDIGVGYNRIGEGTLIRFTVYVYAQRAFDTGGWVSPVQQFALEKDAIRATHESVTESWSHVVTFVRGAKSIRGSAAEFRYPERFADETTTVVSQLYLFRLEGRYVKYRLSFSASRESVARPVVEALLESAPWGRVDLP